MRRLGRRDVLRKAIAHFSTPGVKLAYDDTQGTCKYRLTEEAADSVRCAVGVCIPDDIYTPKMEGRGVRGLLREFPQVADLFTEQAKKDYFLRDLQSIHDNESSLGSGNPERVVRKLRDYARRNGIRL